MRTGNVRRQHWLAGRAEALFERVSLLLSEDTRLTSLSIFCVLLDAKRPAHQIRHDFTRGSEPVMSVDIPHV